VDEGDDIAGAHRNLVVGAVGAEAQDFIAVGELESKLVVAPVFGALAGRLASKDDLLRRAVGEAPLEDLELVVAAGADLLEDAGGADLAEAGVALGAEEHEGGPEDRRTGGPMRRH
jgi:hypothetical protein